MWVPAIVGFVLGSYFGSSRATAVQVQVANQRGKLAEYEDALGIPPGTVLVSGPMRSAAVTAQHHQHHRRR